MLATPLHHTSARAARPPMRRRARGVQGGLRAAIFPLALHLLAPPGKRSTRQMRIGRAVAPLRRSVPPHLLALMGDTRSHCAPTSSDATAGPQCPTAGARHHHWYLPSRPRAWNKTVCKMRMEAIMPYKPRIIILGTVDTPGATIQPSFVLSLPSLCKI
jgi:hypothetical protein